MDRRWTLLWLGACALAGCGRFGFAGSSDDELVDLTGEPDGTPGIDAGSLDATTFLAPPVLCNTSADVSPVLADLCSPPFAQALYRSDDGTTMFTDPQRTTPLTGTRWLRCVDAADGVSIDPGTGAVTGTPAGCQAALHAGMTWIVEGTYVDDLGVSVMSAAADGLTNPYSGDTATSTALPLLCLLRDTLPAPTPNSYYDPFYREWSGGHLAATQPVLGSLLTSAAAGDALCSQLVGAGYEFVEFHDSGGGWGIIGEGSLSAATRYWTWISDQPANPWD